MYMAEMLACDLVHEKVSIFAPEMVAYGAPLAGAHGRTLGHQWEVAKRGELSHSTDGCCSCVRRTEPALKSPLTSVFFTPQKNLGAEDRA